MKIIILDDARVRRNDLTDKLRKKRNEVTPIYGSNDFIDALEKSKCDLLLLDMESWSRGKPIYERFGIAKKLENTPILFYNTPASFSALDERSRHPKDRILVKPTEADAVIAAL